VKAYFTKYLYNQESKWDSKGILDQFKSRDQELLFQYRTAADDFKLIENQQIPIVIPYNDEARKVIDEELRNDSIPLHRKLLRKLQRYTVQIYSAPFFKNQHQFETLRDGQFHVLICPETHYSELYGLILTDEAANSTTLIS
jgi:hypothetical protein